MSHQAYTNRNVLTAAQERVSWIFDNYKSEEIIVSISGGKDSTVLAHLMLSEANRRGVKIGIFFLDEEVVYDSTVEMVRHCMYEMFPDNTIPIWYQIEFNLTNSTSIYESQLKCWEKGKHEIWMRTREPNSIHHKPWNTETEIRNKYNGLGFYEVMENYERTRSGCAHIVGLRAIESPNRWKAVVNKKTKKGVYWGTDIANDSCKYYPIYDWNFSDIWRYIKENNLRYSKIYDMQYKKGFAVTEMRVSSLVHEKSFRAIVELAEFEPKTYERMTKRMDGIKVAALYGKEDKMFKFKKLPNAYKSWKDYRDFLLANHEAEHKDIFVKRFSKQFDNEYVARQQVRQLVMNDYENNLSIKNRPDPKALKREFWESVL
jgi:Predicted phosphoadenosine phosphosulfate sulfotransferase